jgi:hypothetical protein
MRPSELSRRSASASAPPLDPLLAEALDLFGDEEERFCVDQLAGRAGPAHDRERPGANPAFKCLDADAERRRCATFRDADADARPQFADDAAKPPTPVRVGDRPEDAPELDRMPQCLVWSVGSHAHT